MGERGIKLLLKKGVDVKMKTYTIEEVIAMLRENPNRRFNHEDTNEGSYATNEGGNVVWRGEGQNGQSVRLTMDMEWFEVDVPMTFQEVCEKIAECGNTYQVKVEHGDIVRELDFDFLDDLLVELGSKYTSTTLARIISNGQWYIRATNY